MTLRVEKGVSLVLVSLAALHSCMFHCFDWLATSG
jgi:hypothetical protein